MIYRLTSKDDGESINRKFEDANATIARLTAERDQARAEAVAAYNLAAKIVEPIGKRHPVNQYGETMRRFVQEIRALATDPGTTALAEIVKRAVDAETRACAQICDRNDQVGGWVSRDTILARLDHRKEAGA